MTLRKFFQVSLPALLVCLATTGASAQSFLVQCPTKTPLHPVAVTTEPSYTGPSLLTPTVGGVKFNGSTAGQSAPYVSNGGAIKCQEISGGDGFMTEADGTQTYLFAFGPLSGLSLIQKGLPGTQFAPDFNQPFNPETATFQNGQPNPLYNKNVGSPDGAVKDPAAIMNTGVMNGNIPGPLMAIDEDDEFFLTLSNVGMIMRPDLFEQHTVHFHGYPNASSFYDGVPDASVAINIGGSFTYYYLAPDAGTYFWHCHITPPEHLQMGMVGQLYVRPRQNRVPVGSSLYAALQEQDGVAPGQTLTDLRTVCNPAADILCSTTLPPANSVNQKVDPFAGIDSRIPVNTPQKYAYNDGDGSTAYQIDVPIQIHGFDPNFHFVGMTFNPEGFADMKDKYFLLNGRSYPDTIGVPGYAGLSTTPNNIDATTNAMSTEGTDGVMRPSQPLPTLITLKQGEKALLRIADLDVTEYQTLASLGIPMQLIAHNAKLLRDQAGNNLYVTTNSITLGGGESLDVILDSSLVSPGTYFLYTPNLDHLSNDAENFGGLMTEIQVIP